MALIPVLAMLARRLAPRLDERKPPIAAAAAHGAACERPQGRAIVVGHGRVGQVVCDMLDGTAFPTWRPTATRRR